MSSKSMSSKRLIAAAAAAAVAALVVAATAHADEEKSAAIGFGANGVIGVAENVTTSQEDARNQAVADCTNRGGIHCISIANATNGCVAVAVGALNAGGGIGKTREIAEQMARGSSKGGVLKLSTCSIAGAYTGGGAGSALLEVEAPPPVTNAIQASFGDPGLSTLDFNVINTSALTATCNYTATANSLNPLVPKKTTRQFNVPANGNHTESFNGAPTLTSYNVTLSCKDASGKQKEELGHVDTSVLW
jgi:hypothetical protein